MAFVESLPWKQNKIGWNKPPSRALGKVFQEKQDQEIEGCLNLNTDTVETPSRKLKSRKALDTGHHYERPLTPFHFPLLLYSKRPVEALEVVLLFLTFSFLQERGPVKGTIFSVAHSGGW